MSYHIVRMNEKISQIALTYNLEVEEITSLNQHVRDWDHLIAGTKLNLPAIPNSLSDEINDVEPFIEEYYPKINSQNEYTPQEVSEVVENKQNESNNENELVKKTISDSKPKQVGPSYSSKPSVFYNGYYPLYPPYYPYYSSYYRRRKSSSPKK